MIARKDWMTNYTPFDMPISIGLGDDSVIKAIRSGSIRITMDVGKESRHMNCVMSTMFWT